MPCGCKKREPIVQNSKPIVEEFNTEEIEGHILVPTIITGMTYDWYNNIDEIEPISGQSRN